MFWCDELRYPAVESLLEAAYWVTISTCFLIKFSLNEVDRAVEDSRWKMAIQYHCWTVLISPRSHSLSTIRSVYHGEIHGNCNCQCVTLKWNCKRVVGECLASLVTIFYHMQPKRRLMAWISPSSPWLSSLHNLLNEMVHAICGLISSSVVARVLRGCFFLLRNIDVSF